MNSLRPRTRMRTWLGGLAERFVPELAQADLPTPENRHRRFLQRQILFARQQRSLSAGDMSGIEATLHEGWRRDVHDFFDSTVERNEGWYFSQHQPIVQALRSLCVKRAPDRVVEVGCGNGFVMKHLSGKLPGIGQFIGLDINDAIIARNRKVHADNRRLEFVAGDMLTELPGLIEDDTLLLSYGGVFEYLSPASLASVLQQVAHGKRRSIALVEPVDPAHDLAANPASHVFGNENSFSHNHEAMLGEAGLRILWKREIQHDGIRWMMMIAVGPD